MSPGRNVFRKFRGFRLCVPNQAQLRDRSDVAVGHWGFIAALLALWDPNRAI